MNETNMAAPLPFQVSVCSRANVSMFAASGISHLLSIDNPGKPTPTPEWFSGIHWHVVFQDVESESEAREYFATAPTRQDVQQILVHAASCLESSRSGFVHLLVHCMAGASRSTAAAYAILTKVLGPGSELDSLKQLIKIKPDAFPNKLVVQFADELLGRNGKMLEALRPLREEVNRAVDEWAEMMESRRRRGTEQSHAEATSKPAPSAASKASDV